MQPSNHLKPRILFLAHRLPYPPDSGGSIKRWKVVEFLAREYELGVAVLCSSQDLPHQDSFLERVKLLHFHASVVNRPRSVLNFCRSLLKGLPLAVYRNDWPAFKRHVKTIAGAYDVLYLDSLLVFPAVPKGFMGRVILHAHNAEYLIWERYAAEQRNPLLKALVMMESTRVRHYERFACRRADRVLAAPNDQAFLVRLGLPAAKFLDTFHLGDEGQLALPDVSFSETEEALLFVGSLEWEPNLDGLVWFLAEVWDRLKAAHPRLKLYILGRNPGARLGEAAKGRRDIVMPGFVEDLEPYHHRCRVFIAPLRFGSGMKVKIINAMYRGIPVVTTPVGAEGLEVEDMCHLSVSEEADKMTRDIGLLLTDGEAWGRMRDESRRHAHSRFGWERVYGPLREAVEGGAGSPQA